MVFSPINLLLGAQDDAQLGGMFLERSQEKGGCYAFSILPSQKIFIFQFMTFFPSLYRWYLQSRPDSVFRQREIHTVKR